jgi:hypothetical protein
MAYVYDSPTVGFHLHSGQCHPSAALLSSTLCKNYWMLSHLICDEIFGSLMQLISVKLQEVTLR